MKGYREYDLSTERIKIGTDKIDPDGHYIVLANHKGKTVAGSASASPIFSYTMPFHAPYDPTRYKDTHKVSDEFKLVIEEECQEVPFEVVFEKKCKPLFFDLPELPTEQIPEQSKKYEANPPLKYSLMKTFTQMMYPQASFKYVTRGIRSDVNQEFLFVGGLHLDEASKRIVMRNPAMVIGSDRLELYEFLARRKNFWGV